jgi:nucleotide-binding universal stress UspA family protein
VTLPGARVTGMVGDAESGPLLLAYDGSEQARHAIEAAGALVERDRPAVLLYVYKPTERGLGVAQAITGGRIDAPVSSEPEAHDVLEAGAALAREVGFTIDARLVAADRSTAEIIAATADEVDAPAIVMGQRGHGGLKSAILGSVSRAVVTSDGHRPVLLV